MTHTTRRTFMTAAAAGSVAAAIGSASAQTSQIDIASRAGQGRAAIITGSSRGIGAATARRLAREGYAITVNCLTNRDLAEEVTSQIEADGGRAIWLQADVADPSAVQALFDANDDAFGGVDIVINNAGIMNVGAFAQMTDQAFDRMMATNVKGSFNVLREAARRTRDGGSIISLSSNIITQQPAGTGAYAATKSAQQMFTATLAKELAGRNIAVNAVAPGAVDTQLLRQHGTDEMLAAVAAQTPFGRLAHPDDIAEVIARLVAPGRWINGQLVVANGGLS